MKNQYLHKVKNPCEKIKIVFIHPQSSTFIENDLTVLQRHFNIKVIQWTRTIDIKNVLYIIWYIFRSDLSFIWFAGGYASRIIFFSKLFRKKSIAVVGGYEVANEAEIDYGAMTDSKSANKVKYVMRNANKLIAVSEFTKKEILTYLNTANPTVIYNGINTDKFKPKDNNKEDIIITVGSKIKLKGIDTFIKVAKLLSKKTFIIIGLPENVINYLKPSKPPNLELVGFISHEDILQYYQKAKVYCQLSCRESFGMALAEAMACECVPVVTNTAALPEVVGDAGFYVSYGDPKATAKAIKEALKSNKGTAARKRIKMMFPLEKRERELIRIIEELIYNVNK